MSVAIDSASETRRLEAVRRYDILDTPPDGSFDHVAAVAAKLFAVPIAIISLVDTDRIWFKSHHGLDVAQIERSPGLCASAILENGPYLVTDAVSDPRTLANPLVAGAFGLRFYAAAPLRTMDGYNLGTLCVIDRKPRMVSPAELDQLTHLAAVVMDQMELRLSARKAVADVSRALARAEMLSREIDHRVKNSLQFVANSLEMQTEQVQHAEVSEQLRQAASRVTTVARAHRHFYVEGTHEHTCAFAYLRRLCADIGGILDLAITVKGTALRVESDQIMPLGLITNELVTNAAKRGARAICVKLERVGQKMKLCVSNDGEPLPSDFDPYARKGMGMRIVRSLTQQLGGELSYGSLDNGTGAFFCVTAPAVLLPPGAMPPDIGKSKSPNRPTTHRSTVPCRKP